VGEGEGAIKRRDSLPPPSHHSFSISSFTTQNQIAAAGNALLGWRQGPRAAEGRKTNFSLLPGLRVHLYI